MLHHETHHCPQCAVQLFTITLEAPLAPVQVNAIQEFAEYIQLLLTHRAVPNAHRSRIPVPIEISQLTLRQFTLTSYAIHDLQVLAIRVREAAQPMGESVSLFRETKHAQRINRKGSIAQPGNPVIPVAYPTQVFRHSGSGVSDTPAGLSVLLHFAHHR